MIGLYSNGSYRPFGRKVGGAHRRDVASGIVRCRLLILTFVLCLPATAHAWVDAQVRSARARVSIDDAARAHVVLDATLRIDGGWLGQIHDSRDAAHIGP